jgi:hypothetical protein
MTIRDALVGRWKWGPESPRLLAAKVALERVLDANDAVRAQHAKIGSDPKLTAIGRQDAIRRYVIDKAAEEQYRAVRSVAEMRARVDRWRKELSPKAPDKSDVTAAVVRSEMRQMLRSMTPNARAAMLTSADVDPTLIQAVLEVPNSLSGITDRIRADVVKAAISRSYPKQLTEIEQCEDAIALVDAAARVMTDTTRAAMELPNDTVLADLVKGALGPRVATIDKTVETQFCPPSAPMAQI